MKKYGMVIDLRKCIDCKGCIAICSMTWNSPINRELDDPVLMRKEIMAWLDGDVQQMNSRLEESIREDGNMLSVFEPCMHCDEPACVEACPVDAITKNEDGIVLVDYDKCEGDGSCIDACPYGKPYIREFSSPSAPAQRADKCTFCVEFINKGELPACVRTCQGHALYFGDLLDTQSEVSRLLNKEKHRAYVLAGKDGKFVKIADRTKTMTKPNVYYLA